MNQHPALSAVGFAVCFVALWITVGFIVSLIGGWRSLAERYRTDRVFPAHKRWMQSAQMRFLCGYNHVLTLASDSNGLYLATFFLFRVGHPPLFIPWNEIKIGEVRLLLLIKMRTLRLGPDAIPLRVSERLAQFLLEPRGGMGAAATAATAGTISSTF